MRKIKLLMRRNKHAYRVGMMCLDLLRHFKAAYLFHFDIGQNNICMFAPQMLQHLASVRIAAYYAKAKFFPVDDTRKACPDARLIIGNDQSEHARLLFIHVQMMKTL